jgi:glycosyltransferase involved in cell wall biosynthesis
MKVCFVSHSSAKGGGERSLLETVRALRARNVECTALVPRLGPLASALVAEGVDVAVVPYRWWAGPEGGPRWKRAARTAWNLAWTPAAYARIRQWDPDIVYTNTLTVPVGAWAAALAGRAHVWHIRELGHEHNRMVFDLGDRLSLGIMDRLSVLCLTNSHCVADRYRGAFAPGKVEVVYQGVEPEQGPAGREVPAKRGFRCMAVGALSPAKRYEEAIEATARLRDEGRVVELLIVGSGDPGYEGELRGLVERLGLVRTVSLLGEVDPAYPFIASADVVVNCSRHEAFGRVTVEAMLAGKPVVGARSGGTAELIRHGANGFLYEMGDVAGLAAILRRLIEHPAEAARIGSAARAWAAGRFSRERYGEELLKHLRHVQQAR